MTIQPPLERKVRQLDNDVTSIYEILARIELKQGRHDNRFEEIGADLDVLKGDVAGLKGDVAELRSDMSGVKDQLGEVLEILRDR